MKKGMIFDLDGTMWDSSREVAEAYNISLEKQGIPLRFTLSDIRNAMGKTMIEIAHIAFDSVDPERAVEIMSKCIDEENEYLKTHSGSVYPGLEQALISLKDAGWTLICVSNCQSGYIEAFYEATGLGKYFDDSECWGGTGLGKADNIRTVVKRNSLEFAAYIGDTVGDLKSATEAGAAFIHAAYGFGRVPEGTRSIADISELPAAAEEILASRG